jgi:hypothetical protein
VPRLRGSAHRIRPTIVRRNIDETLSLIRHAIQLLTKLMLCSADILRARHTANVAATEQRPCAPVTFPDP